jgi:Flp pilus assembly protein TadG
MPRRSRRRLRDDDGQVLLLTLLYVVLAMSLVVVVIDATAVHLARTQLLDAADAAALDAADSIDVASTYGQADDASTGGQPGQPRHLVLTDASVRREVDAYVSTYEPPTRVDGVIDAHGTGSKDGRSATVVLTGSVRLPLVGAVVQGWTDGISVTVRSTAIAPVVDE